MNPSTKGVKYRRSILLGALGALLCAGPASAAGSFLDVGKQEPITIQINSSPWYAGFQSVVQLYQQQTGNRVTLDVTPFTGMLEKARNDVRGTRSPDDVVNLNAGTTVEFYKGGFVTPLDKIEPGYALPKEVFTCGDSYFWNAQKQWSTHVGGELMAIPPNCNTHLLVYRKDLFDKAGLAAPKTYDELLADCQKLQSKPRLYGFVTRGERGNGIWFDFMPFMFGYGGRVAKDPENGDYTVVVNSVAADQALTTFIKIMKSCGPANAGSVGQSDVIQLMAAGKAVMVESVVAAWANFEDPDKSLVAGKVAAAVNPAPAGHPPGVIIGNWHFAIPTNIPESHKKAAMAFFKWFLTHDAQKAYAEAGAIPVRSDVLEELSKQPKYAWMAAYNESMKYGRQSLNYTEGPEIQQVIGLRLNQALIGELSPAAALNKMATEIHAVFVRTGRKTGMLQPLPE